MDWVNVLTSGGAVAFVTWVANRHTARVQAHTERLRAQLEELYGPLAFLVATSRMLLDHANNIAKDSAKVYGPNSGHNWKLDHVVERLGKEIEASIDIQNQYARQVLTTHGPIVDLLKAKYHQLDAEDQALCNSFVLNRARLATERDETGKLRIPIALYERGEVISFMHPEFLRLVETRFAQKQEELRNLTEPRRLWQWPQRLKP